MKVYTVEEWKAEAVRLFGTDGDVRGRDIKFKCAKCGTVQSGQEFLDVGLTEEQAIKVFGFSCIGRYVENRGCDWTLGGVFAIHKVEVIDATGTHFPFFEFAEPEQKTASDGVAPDVIMM